MFACTFGLAVPTRAADLVIDDCVVKPDEDVELSADEAGKLVQLSVKEGSRIQAGQEIALVDDRQPQVQVKAAKFAYAGALKRYEDDIQVRYAKAAAAVAKAEYDKAVESNLLVEKSVTQVDVDRAKLEWDKNVLSIEKSKYDQQLAMLEAYGKQAELEAAELAIDRRKILAPFDGEVVTLVRDQDEWVNPGDPVMRVMRFDTMRVEGIVDQKMYDPHEIQGCEVTVEVTLARGRREQFPGRITYVGYEVGYNDDYLVRAEVANRQEFGRWMLLPGHAATMTIHLGTGTGGPAAPVNLSRTP